MKRILEHDQAKRYQIYCDSCKTLFDYQDEDIEVINKDWIEQDRYESSHWYSEVLFVTCPRCGRKHTINKREWSRDCD